MKRPVLIAATIGLAGMSMGLPAQPASAAFAVGCGNGVMCFWEGGIGVSAALQSANRDPDFRDDRYANGRVLDNNADWGENNFNAVINVGVYSGPTYTVGFRCAGWQEVEALANFSSSSFKSVDCH